MVKKSKAKAAASGAAAGKSGEPKVNKSAAIRDYLKDHHNAMPKEIVAALKEKGIDVSPNMVSIIKAKSKVKKAQRQAKQAVAKNDSTAGARTNRADGLDAALTLYKAAQGQELPNAKVRQSFLLLIDLLG